MHIQTGKRRYCFRKHRGGFSTSYSEHSFSERIRNISLQSPPALGIPERRRIRGISFSLCLIDTGSLNQQPQRRMIVAKPYHRWPAGGIHLSRCYLSSEFFMKVYRQMAKSQATIFSDPTGSLCPLLDPKLVHRTPSALKTQTREVFQVINNVTH